MPCLPAKLVMAYPEQQMITFRTSCDCSRHIQESRGPLGPKSPKSLKKVFPGVPARSVKKVSKKSQMTRKRVKKTTKSVFGDFVDTFLTLRAGRPGTTFLRLFGIWGLGGVETPVYGDCNRNFRTDSQGEIKTSTKFSGNNVWVSRLPRGGEGEKGCF